MFKKLKYKIKKTNLGILILKFKFLLNLGLEKEAKYLKKIIHLKTPQILVRMQVIIQICF